MNDQPRPVWLTESQHRALTIIVGDFEGSDQMTNAEIGLLQAIKYAYEEAPADATEAVGDVFERMGIPNYRMDVLRALGYPS